MVTQMKESLLELLNQALETLKSEGLLSQDFSTDIRIDGTRDKSHGDYATNLAMVLAKPAGMPPREIADRLINALPASDIISKVEVKGPGFINFFANTSAAAQIVDQVLQQGDQFGHSSAGKDASEKVQVEFVSANPTGPLHVGHGRNAVLGDCIARLLEATGYQVTREFYYNDAGAQIENLTRSVIARIKGLEPSDPSWPEDGYRGEYIKDIAHAYMQGETVVADDRQVTAKADAEDNEAVREFSVAYLRHEQDLDLKAFAIEFDNFFLESSLYKDGKVAETVDRLVSEGHTYEADGALWLRTTEYGDDKDRVMRKKDGHYTYFLPDVAYHLDKWRRGFKTVINVHGADHHSTLARVRAGLQALDEGIPKGWPSYAMYQMVTVMRGGEEVKLSKRAGSYVTLRDLIDEVGKDATRYFLVSRKGDSQLTFDIDLALSQSADNPVYYLQYAHARLNSILRKAAEQGTPFDSTVGLENLALLEDDREKALLNKMAGFPELIQRAAKAHEPHQVAQYLQELAADFHSYYNAVKIMTDDVEVRNARLALASAVKQVLRNGLELLGLSAPEEM